MPASLQVFSPAPLQGFRCLRRCRSFVACVVADLSLPASLQIFRCLRRCRSSVACSAAGLPLQHEHCAHEGTVAGYLSKAQSQAHNLW